MSLAGQCDELRQELKTSEQAKEVMERRLAKEVHTNHVNVRYT